MITGGGGARYREVADHLRDRITRGEWPPGGRFRSETDIQGEYEVSRTTARHAMDLLRQWGLIVIEHGHPTRVSETRTMQILEIPAGHRVGARTAGPAEAREWSIAEGSPVLVLIEEYSGLEVDSWPADRYQLRP